MGDQCKEWIRGNTYRGRRCGRKAVTDGYCKQHHPDTVKARRAKQSAVYDRRRARRSAVFCRHAARSAFCEGFPTDQLKPGGLRKLVEAAFDLSFKSLAGTATLEDLERIDEALAPFKGGDDGEQN